MLLALAFAQEAPAQGIDRSAATGQGNLQAASSGKTSGTAEVLDKVARHFREALNVGRKRDWSRSAGLDLDVVRKLPGLVLARLHQRAMLILNGREAEGREVGDQTLGRHSPRQRADGTRR
jgi:hypothetical protein